MWKIGILSFVSMYGFGVVLHSIVDIEVQRYVTQELEGFRCKEHEIQVVRKVWHLLLSIVFDFTT